MIEVRNRELIIPKSEVYIGTVGDNNSENRLFRIPRYIPNGIDLAALSFRLDLENRNGQPNTAELEKEVTEEHIILKWNIIQNDVAVSGTLFVNIRATDYQGTVKWNSFKGAFYVETVINTAEEYNGKLSEMEQMEFRIDEKTRILDANEDVRQAQEAARQTNTAAAIASADQARDKANSSSEKADQAATRASTAAEGVEAAIDRANTAASNTEDTIARAENAAKSANDAAGSVNTAKTNANNAAKAANDAAAAANTAKNSADKAAAGANAATASADTAAVNANAKAIAANNAATEANTAKTNADMATKAANTAAANADTKAGLANTAATSANNAASVANTAKANADKATTSANTAAANANTKAALADTKASYAQTQGTYAKEQGDLAKEIVSGSGFVVAAGGDVSNTVIKLFDTVQEELPVPAPEDTMGKSFGKIRKFFEDMKNIKTTLVTVGMVINNFSTTQEGTVADGRALKTIWDKLTTVENVANQLNRDLELTKSNLDAKIPYAITISVSSTKNFTFKSKYDTVDGSGASLTRQSIFMFISSNGIPIYGMMTITNKGSVTWSGTDNVTATISSNGRVTVTLPNTAYDIVTLMSGEALEK